MKLLRPYFKILSEIDGEQILKNIERAGRTCYKSEDRITTDSAKTFVAMILKRGHLSVIEHQSITVLFVSNRGYSHEQVRHRLASYSQESTRFVNYSVDRQDQQIKCIDLAYSLRQYGKNLNEKGRNFTEEELGRILDRFINSWNRAERDYMELIDLGVEPQFARNVLPIGIKTEIVVTCNLREWREILRQRTSDAAHPNMKELMRPLLDEFKKYMPIVFDDITY